MLPQILNLPRQAVIPMDILEEEGVVVVTIT